MNCPFCGHPDSRVIDSRPDAAGIRRRRECQACSRRFTTLEKVELGGVAVIKKDDNREEFDREKIISGVRKACEKRPVSADDVERLVDRLERQLQELGEKEVSSQVVGERVMEELKQLDALAAARFASVFRDFQGAEDYAEFFASIEGSDRETGSS